MIRSMTGFGGAQAHIAGIRYAVEVRSLNGRYFKPSIKLPEMWTHAEAAIEKLLRQHLSRGSLYFTLRMQMEDESAAYTVNPAALRHYIDQARAALPGSDGVTFEVGSLLLLPGVCVPPAADELVEKSWPALRQAIEQAVEQLMDMRRREGQALHDDLMGHLSLIEQRLEAIAARKDDVVTEYHRRLIARVNELIHAAQLKISEQDLVREVAVYAERSDISEEISRLRSHLEQFRQAAAGEEQAGRKLDFITQEMLREANTIASKANDADIVRHVVDIKSCIDRVKEQVQNVE